MFALMISWTTLKMGRIKEKNRSSGHILEKPFIHHRGHIFSPVLLMMVKMFALMISWRSFEKIKGRVPCTQLIEVKLMELGSAHARMLLLCIVNYGMC